MATKKIVPAGDCPEESVESAEEEETRDNDIVNSIMNFPCVLEALQSRRTMELKMEIANLPAPVKRRIRALKQLQKDQMDIEAKFFEEVHAIECKYHKLYTPFYDKRSNIIMGKYEPTDEESVWTLDDDEPLVEELSKEFTDKVNVEKTKGETETVEKPDEKKDESPANGIPDFWLTIFRNVDLLSEMVHEHDEAVLKHLVDITTVFYEEPMGFALQFHFEHNEYFSDKVLTKEYFMKCVPEAEDPFGFEGPEIFNCKGCTINWNKGKNLTLKTVKKKQKHKSRGMMRTITRVVQNDSFFNFFTPPPIPEDINAEDVDEETRRLLTTDFEIGHYIRERIVPRAVLYFTGEGIEEEFDDDDEEEEEEEDDEEEDDDEECETSPAALKNTANQQNCKQQ